MNAIRRLIQRLLRKPVIAHLPIRGLKHYRAADLSDIMQRGDPLTLQREPDNPHDRNAVMVLWHQNKIGYIPASKAELVQHLISRYGGRIHGEITEIEPESDDSQWISLAIYPDRQGKG
ncbi:MAG: HIRAN domain-containing protein [Cardiobacteriaceae bacterium]|nr:HIRAN domain-containing protein [Cardiobacteriaceae bacterium]